jgi:hypothetical protein
MNKLKNYNEFVNEGLSQKTIELSEKEIEHINKIFSNIKNNNYVNYFNVYVDSVNDVDENDELYVDISIGNIGFTYGIIKKYKNDELIYNLYFMDDTLEYVGNGDIYPKMQDYLYSTNVNIFPTLGEDIILNSLTDDEDIEKIKSRFKTIKEKYDNEIKPYENKLTSKKKFKL